MNTADILAGGFYALAVVFAATSIGFAMATRDRVFFLFALHAGAIGGLALTFPPIAPAASAVEHWHIVQRIIAECCVLATTGLFLRHVTADNAPAWLRGMSNTITPASFMLAFAAPWLPTSALYLQAFGGAMLAILVLIIATLAACSWRGDRDARIFALAITPLVAVGVLAAVIEMLGLPSFSIYVEGMLFGFAFEMVVVSVMLALRLRVIMLERDEAFVATLMAREASERDPLTGLLNRLGLERHTASFTGRLRAVAVLDCDHFKVINDTHGHKAGDDVLRVLGDILQAVNAKAVRLGGEEFLLPLEGRDWLRQLEALRVSIPRTVRHKLPDLHVPVTISIGVSPVTGRTSLQTAWERADEALYAAKADGRDRIALAQRTPLALNRAA